MSTTLVVKILSNDRSNPAANLADAESRAATSTA
jgi:hypothetical protein